MMYLGMLDPVRIATRVIIGDVQKHWILLSSNLVEIVYKASHTHGGRPTWVGVLRFSSFKLNIRLCPQLCMIC